ncbi:MAG: hypothetical protein IJG38_03790 [Thermoguttaceae bacterium]|nr:hypothetical protein [Thermoguttaceae bacterium]
MNPITYKQRLKALKKAFKEFYLDDNIGEMTINLVKQEEKSEPLTCQFRKINPNVRLPERNGAAWDLFLPADVHIEAGQTVKIPLGFAAALPEGYSAFILMRSSTWQKWGICLGNQLGLWDGGYRGNKDLLGLICYRPNSYKDYPTVIPAGTRIAQFIIFKNPPDLNFEVVESLPDASRGGFGSTGI